MLGRRPKKSPQVKGQAATTAKQHLLPTPGKLMKTEALHNLAEKPPFEEKVRLGLFVEFNPEEMMLDLEDDGDLEAELAAITGEKLPVGKSQPKGKTPLPMEHIEKMAAECMQDLNEEDDEGLEEDTELLAELQLVLGDEDGEESCEHETETMEVSSVAAEEHTVTNTGQVTPAVSSGLQQSIEERISNYKAAIANAKEAGESAKVRRYERGLKALETMLTAVKKGKKVNEEEMPPPVASGKSSLTGPRATHHGDLPQNSGTEEEISVPEQEEERGKEHSSTGHDLKNTSDLEQPVSPAAIQEQAVDMDVPGVGATAENDSPNPGTRALLVTREKEYKLAALKAKQRGDLEKAKEYMRTGKKFSMVLEALDSGQPIDLKDMPPAPQELESPEKIQLPSKQTSSVPVETSQPVTSPDTQGNEARVSLQQPKTVLEALQQRLERYKAAALQAKANGDNRKGRMHERIAKQYQDAIRSHKAGRKVNFAELPVPPGFPPIPGMSMTEDSHAIAVVLETADKLVRMEEEENVKNDDEEEEEDESSVQALPNKQTVQLPKKPVQVVQPMTLPSAVVQEETSPEEEHSGPTPVAAPEKSASSDPLCPAVKEQLEILESRKKQYLKAAIQAKKQNDLEQAKMYLRIAKSLDPKIELAKSSKLVDISKIQNYTNIVQKNKKAIIFYLMQLDLEQAMSSKFLTILANDQDHDEGDFIFIHHEDVRLSQKAEEVYMQLMKLLRDQYEKCVQYSKQFTHLGNVAETSRFEKLAQNCKQDLDILRLAQAQGLDPPSHHFEERTFKIVRIFSELSSTEMHLIIVRGINLPAPPGVAPNDLDAFVKFEFHYPNSEQAQKSKTSVIKNTNCPEYDQLFKLNINRNHRGFRRAIQAKGIKFEVFHKGSFFRSDKHVGTAHLKLDKLESQCEIREIIEVLDSRKPTGGKLEVKVRLREPLSGQDLQTITENWLVLEH